MASELQFTADFMLGKLVKTLRLLGIDTKYVRYSRSETALAESLKEKRILLTRAHKFPEIKTVFVIESEILNDQLKQLNAEFHIKLQINSFTRCLNCNNSLERVPKSAVKSKVPPYIYKTQSEFSYCKKCNKYYWKGTHYQALTEKIRKLLS